MCLRDEMIPKVEGMVPWRLLLASNELYKRRERVSGGCNRCFRLDSRKGEALHSSKFGRYVAGKFIRAKLTAVTPIN